MVDVPILKRCISAFNSLSMVILIHRIRRDIHRYPSWEGGPAWKELEDLAISQLEGSSADGPKKLKTVKVFVGRMIEPELVTEEMIV